MMRKHARSNWILLAALAGLLIGYPGQADADRGQPVAIVEDVAAPETGLELMDFLFDGTVIRLQDSETLRLAYLHSCIVETLTGGTVIVGKSQSQLSDGGLIYREMVDCDGGGIAPTEGQSQDVAGTVFRAPTEVLEASPVTIYSTTPLFVFSQQADELIVERLDPGFEERHRFSMADGRLDLANTLVTLTAGGLYRATTVSGSAVFRISRRANGSSAFIINRLVRL